MGVVLAAVVVLVVVTVVLTVVVAVVAGLGVVVAELVTSRVFFISGMYPIVLANKLRSTHCNEFPYLNQCSMQTRFNYSIITIIVYCKSV